MALNISCEDYLLGSTRLSGVKTILKPVDGDSDTRPLLDYTSNEVYLVNFYDLLLVICDT